MIDSSEQEETSPHSNYRAWSLWGIGFLCSPLVLLLLAAAVFWLPDRNTAGRIVLGGLLAAIVALIGWAVFLAVTLPPGSSEEDDR